MTVRPIERYVRCAVEIPGSKGRVDGVIEIGLHYEDSDLPSKLRPGLLEEGAKVARWFGPLDEDEADRMTRRLDELLVARFGDRPRFIEVWRGSGDDVEPLAQTYAPHGMPRDR